MEFLIDYGSFLLKTISLIIIISIPFFILFLSKGKDASASGTLKITNLSDKLDNMAGAVKSLTLNKNNNYTVRTFARGYKHQVKFQLTSAQTVRFFELQFRSR